MTLYFFLISRLKNYSTENAAVLERNNINRRCICESVEFPAKLFQVHPDSFAPVGKYFTFRHFPGESAGFVENALLGILLDSHS